MSGRVPLAEKALSESYARLRYRDTSLLIWQQQQQKLASALPGTYLSRSRSMWYSLIALFPARRALPESRRGLRQCGRLPGDDRCVLP